MANDVKYLISLQDKFSGKLNTINKSTQSFDKSIGRTIGRFASFAAVGAILTDSVKKIAQFEEQVSNLSAITGLVGDDLDFISKKAIELGGATTKSSIDTVKAFKLIASAKPELLNNAAALAKVTEEAIALSEASGLDLPTAATALTDSLNQFALSADQSSRVINILAAGSKFAAAEIPDLTMSLKEFGGVADSLNISLEESAAAVETLSSKGLKGSRAGMQMRNVLLKLGASADKKINPKIVGLSKALENLADIEDDTTKLTKMFGRQNVLAAQTLIKNRQRVDELTESLTGTNIAYEQQAINTDNLVSDYKRLGSSWEKLVLNLNEGSGSISNALRNATQWATNFLDAIDKINQGEKLREQKAKKKAGLGGQLEAYENELPDKVRQLAELQGKSEEDVRLEMLKTAKLRLETANKAVEVNDKLIKSIDSKLWASRKEQVKAAKAHGKRAGLAVEQGLAKGTLGILEDMNFSGIEPITPPEATVSGLDEVEDQVTKITSAAPKTFNININNLVENFSVNSQTVNEGAVAARETVVEELTRAVADVQARA